MENVKVDIQNVKVDIQEIDNNCDLFEGQIKDFETTTKDITENDARFHHELGKLMNDYDAKQSCDQFAGHFIWGPSILAYATRDDILSVQLKLNF